MQKTLGGDRLGSGNKFKVNLHDYGSSNHNLSRAWRSTMSCGTLVPFMVEPALNGDQFDIDVNALVRTLPTIAPMFGSFKLQIDVFVAPLRLYNKQLHNNKLNIGLKMENVIFPLLRVDGYSDNRYWTDQNHHNINPSSLLAYLGIRGLGMPENLNTTGTTQITRYFEAQPLLAYWDIFKNYYANKQETNAYVITNPLPSMTTSFISTVQTTQTTTIVVLSQSGHELISPFIGVPITTGDTISVYGSGLNSKNIRIKVERLDISGLSFVLVQDTNIDDSNFLDVVPGATTSELHLIATDNAPGTKVTIYGDLNDNLAPVYYPFLSPFPLTNIDDMREDLLSHPSNVPYLITDESNLPYNACLKHTNIDMPFVNSAVGEMCGLAVKTYQSDRFNNWLSSEWIDGIGGISEITSIDTSSGSFSMDSLNLAQKVYNMLNRIAVSGGSYVDWQEAVYGETMHPLPETPWFAGGTSQEITFSEVTSTSETSETMPLGTLAGKGFASGQSNRIHIKILEPSYIIGIVSITPRIDYSQGNKWFTRLRTMDDLHKPALDGIGFQELITDEFAAWDTKILSKTQDDVRYSSAGKQPSWIHYQTAVNECYGNFALPLQEMYMTLNRNYSLANTDWKIYDLTTYIDPSKFNHNFARTDLGAQNFWVQLGIDIFARRKMSAKQIPNL